MATKSKFKDFKLERASLGRRSSLGQIYDTATDRFIDGQYFSNPLNKTVKEKRQTARYTVYCLGYEFQNYFRFFGIDNDQLLSLMLSLHEPCPFIPFLDTVQRFRNEIVGIFVQTVIESRSSLKVKNLTTVETLPVVQANHYFTRKILYGKVSVFLFLLKERKATIDMSQAKKSLNSFLFKLREMAESDTVDVLPLIYGDKSFICLFENLTVASYFNGVFQVALNITNISLLLQKTLSKSCATCDVAQEPFALAVSLLPVAKLIENSSDGSPIRQFPRIEENLAVVFEHYQCLLYRNDRKYRVFLMEMSISSIPPLPEKQKSDFDNRSKEIVKHIRQNVICLRTTGLDFNLVSIIQMCHYESGRLEHFEVLLRDFKANYSVDCNTAQPVRAVENLRAFTDLTPILTDNINEKYEMSSISEIDPETLIPSQLLDIEEADEIEVASGENYISANETKFDADETKVDVNASETDSRQSESFVESDATTISSRRSYASILKGFQSAGVENEYAKSVKLPEELDEELTSSGDHEYSEDHEYSDKSRNAIAPLGISKKKRQEIHKSKVYYHSETTNKKLQWKTKKEKTFYDKSTKYALRFQVENNSTKAGTSGHFRERYRRSNLKEAHYGSECEDSGQKKQTEDTNSNTDSVEFPELGASNYHFSHVPSSPSTNRNILKERKLSERFENLHLDHTTPETPTETTIEPKY